MFIIKYSLGFCLFHNTVKRYVSFEVPTGNMCSLFCALGSLQRCGYFAPASKRLDKIRRAKNGRKKSRSLPMLAWIVAERSRSPVVSAFFIETKARDT